jgi:hypothetical protein
MVLAIVAAGLGLPQLAPYLHRMGNNFVQVKTIWSGQTSDPRNFLTLWLYGLGAFWIMAIGVGLLWLKWRQFQLYLPALFVFVVANFVWYQPWHLDNTKVFNAGWIPFAVAVVANCLMRIWKSVKTLGPIAAVILFVLSIASGFLAVSGVVLRPYPIWKDPAVARQLADFAKKVSSPRSVWITDQTHVNPIVTLAGRQTLAGYPGWLTSHGLNDTERTMAMSKLTSNPEAVSAVDRWGVEFACVTLENIDWAGNKFFPTPDSNKWKKLFESTQYAIYQRINKTQTSGRSSSTVSHP